MPMFLFERLRDRLRSTAAPRAAAAPCPPAIGEAITRGWMRLWYQPQIDLRTCRLCGAEVLSRMQHPTRGLLGPGAFLPRPDSPDMRALTSFALLKAMDDWRHMADARLQVPISVNVPVSCLISLPIAAMIREHRPRDQRWPGLTLEITEDEFIQDPVLINEIAAQLRADGVNVSIDDFGAGYSTLGRLKTVPFTEIKIDRSLVRDCDNDERSAWLLRTIVELAHGLNTTCVAEGIERAGELRNVMRAGCDIGQGYIFARPLPLADLIALARSRMPAGEPDEARRPAA